jgi:hypothetical protein
MSFAQHNANEISRILGTQLLHDMNAMDLDGPPADAESCRRFLV